MSSPTQMGQIYLIFNQLTFLWDTSERINHIKDRLAEAGIADAWYCAMCVLSGTLPCAHLLGA